MNENNKTTSDKVLERLKKYLSQKRINPSNDPYFEGKIDCYKELQNIIKKYEDESKK